MRWFFLLSVFFSSSVLAQVVWKNADSAFGKLSPNVHVYATEQVLDSFPLRAFYVIAPLQDKDLHFFTDTTLNRRLTPEGFYNRNSEPLVVVNGTFFSFQTNRNLNLVINNGAILNYNPPIQRKMGADSVSQLIYSSAIGISENRNADVAWVVTDSIEGKVFANQEPAAGRKQVKNNKVLINNFSEWKMETAIGGGPVLVQNGSLKITNNEERKFAGKAISDKHPRTAMGYTRDGKLIILAVEGRTTVSKGVDLLQLAKIMLELGCVEAINLDGGGSSCLLVNGKETITPSDKNGQRPVPAVFMIRTK